MKLNPFRKKTSGYYDKLQTEYADLTRQLEAAKKELDAARRDHEAKAQASTELESRHPPQPYLSDAESRLRDACKNAWQLVSEFEHKVNDLAFSLNQLRWKVEAPEKMAEAKASMQRLFGEREALQVDLDKTNCVIAKLEKRIVNLEQGIADETKIASRNMAESDAEFVLPEALTKLDVELRVAQATLAEMHRKAEALKSAIAAIPDSLREAQRMFVVNRAAVAEIDFHEQLPSFIDIIARVAVSRNECAYGQHADSYEIAIPSDVVAAMRATLAAEQPRG